jgi:ABC-type uncharacterized transport system permease subunit
MPVDFFPVGERRQFTIIEVSILQPETFQPWTLLAFIVIPINAISSCSCSSLPNHFPHGEKSSHCFLAHCAFSSSNPFFNSVNQWPLSMENSWITNFVTGIQHIPVT